MYSSLGLIAQFGFWYGLIHYGGVSPWWLVLGVLLAPSILYSLALMDSNSRMDDPATAAALATTAADAIKLTQSPSAEGQQDKWEATADISTKMARYKLTEADLLRENGHAFVEIANLGLKHEGKSCLACGIMRRRDGQNKPCNGHVAVTLR